MTKPVTTFLPREEVVERIEKMMSAHESNVGSILPEGFFDSVKHHINLMELDEWLNKIPPRMLKVCSLDELRTAFHFARDGRLPWQKNQ